MKGTNILAGVDRKKIIKAFFRQANNKYSPKAPPLWDGKAGVRILKIIINKLEGKRGFRVK
jgi:UDP-N-acetylglucosamine 2-epimerase